MRNIGNSSREAKRRLRKVIFIDRDGVINHDPLDGYVTNWKDFRFLPGVLPALKKLTRAGYAIVIVSNQAGIGDGVYSKKVLQEITKKMLARMKRSRIKIHGIFYCLHGKRAGCNCRKPKTGLFRQAARKIYFKPSETYFIGDKMSDVLAGKRFGLKTAFVLTGHGKIHFRKLNLKTKPDLVAKNLWDATCLLLAHGFQTS